MSGCASDGVLAPKTCTGQAIRLSDAEIAALSDEAVEDILTNNEQGAAAGCYKPNGTT